MFIIITTHFRGFWSNTACWLTLLQIPVCYNFGLYRREIMRSRLRANINSSILILTWETCCKDFWLSIHRKNSFHVFHVSIVLPVMLQLPVDEVQQNTINDSSSGIGSPDYKPAWIGHWSWFWKLVTLFFYFIPI